MPDQSLILILLGVVLMAVAAAWRASDPDARAAKGWVKQWVFRTNSRPHDPGLGVQAGSLLPRTRARRFANPDYDEHLRSLIRRHQWEPLTPALRQLREWADREQPTEREHT